MHVDAYQDKDLSRLLEALNTAVVLLDSELGVRCLNPAAENLFEVSKRQVIDAYWPEVIKADPDCVKRIEAALDSGNPHMVREQELWTTSGHHITVDCSVTPIGGDELVLEFVQIDHHLRISREEHLVVQQQSARELLRGLAHEIKNPLGGLRGAAQLLERELVQPEQKEYTQVIIGEADRLRNLVNRMLGPNSVPDMQSVNIHEVLERVRNLVNAEAYAGLTIKRQYDPSIPEFMADSEMLVQAFLNILRNAAQSGASRITLHTTAQRQFSIWNTRHKLVIRIDVTDNGPGIPADLQERIFYPMVSGRAKGTGLGLSIAQSLINQHQGVIECQSEPAETVFTVFLPLEVLDGD